MGFVNPGHYRAVAVVTDEGGAPLRYVYIREHRSSKTGMREMDDTTAGSKGGGRGGGGGGAMRKRSGRTLFVANAQPCFTGCHLNSKDAEELKLELIEQWTKFGKICSVELGGGGIEKENVKDSSTHKHRRIAVDHGQTVMPSSIFARIMFTSSSSLKSALAATTVKALPCELRHQQQSDGDDNAEGGRSSRPGLAKALEVHISVRKDPLELGQEANIWMEAFDKAEMEEKRKCDARAREPDEDGFITVHYKKRGKRQRSEEGWMDAMEHEHRRKKKKDLTLTNFYRHQIREAKRDQLAELRRKFEADKEKVQKMKMSRQLMPFQ